MPESASKSPRRNELLDRLRAEFPIFRDYQPLALGIHKALVERIPELDKAQVRNALHLHTGATRYLKSLVEGAPRLDLDGNPAGAVTAEQQTQAVTTLKERLRKQAEKRRAEDEAKKRQEKEAREARERQEKLEQLARKFSQR